MESYLKKSPSNEKENSDCPKPSDQSDMKPKDEIMFKCISCNTCFKKPTNGIAIKHENCVQK